MLTKFQNQFVDPIIRIFENTVPGAEILTVY